MVAKPVRLLLLAWGLAGCAGAPPYKSDLPPNLNVRTKLSSPSVLLTPALGGSFEADLHVTSVDRRCQKNYRGSVRLDAPAVSVGIPADQPSYLVFEFSGSSAPTRGSASSTYSTLLTARNGYQYGGGGRPSAKRGRSAPAKRRLLESVKLGRVVDEDAPAHRLVGRPVGEQLE